MKNFLFSFRKKCEDNLNVHKGTKIFICTFGLIMMILSMVVQNTWKDRIIVALVAILFTVISLVWNSVVINIIQKFNKKIDKEQQDDENRENCNDYSSCNFNHCWTNGTIFN